MNFDGTRFSCRSNNRDSVVLSPASIVDEERMVLVV